MPERFVSVNQTAGDNKRKSYRVFYEEIENQEFTVDKFLRQFKSRERANDFATIKAKQLKAEAVLWEEGKKILRSNVYAVDLTFEDLKLISKGVKI